MTIHHSLNEETIEPEFLVWVSNKVYDYIDSICACNAGNEDAVSNFIDSFSLIQEHLSYRSIALGYVSNVDEIANKALNIEEFGIRVHYVMKQSETFGNYSVNIYKIQVDFKYFGTINPSAYRRPIQETKNRIILRESQLRSIIRETIKRILISA